MVDRGRKSTFEEEIRAMCMTLISSNSKDIVAAGCQRVKSILSSLQADSSNFTSSVDIILHEAFSNSGKQPGLTNFKKLFQNLIENSMFKKQALITAISSACMKHQVITCKTDAEQFAKRFPVINMLYEFSLLQGGVYKFYAKELTKPESEPSLELLYQILRHVDKLIDVGIEPVGESNAAFWNGCATRLSLACDRNQVTSSNKGRFKSFLEGIIGKGGWNRKPVKQNSSQSGSIKSEDASKGSGVAKKTAGLTAAAVGEVQTVLCSEEFPPLSAVAQHTSGNMTVTHLEQQLAAASLSLKELCEIRQIFEMGENHDNDQKANQLASIIQVKSPKAFQQAVENIFDTLIEQLGINETLLNHAIQLCSKLGLVNFGWQSFQHSFRIAIGQFLEGDGRLHLDKAKLLLIGEMNNAETPEEAESFWQDFIDLEIQYRRKLSACARLVSQLFKIKWLDEEFIVSLIETLAKRRTDDTLTALLALCYNIGNQISQSSSENRLNNAFSLLTEEDFISNCPGTTRFSIMDIMDGRHHNWEPLPDDVRVCKQLRLMLAEMTPEQRQHDAEATVCRIRMFLADVGQQDPSRGLYDVLLGKIQESLAEIRRIRSSLKSDNTDSLQNHVAPSGNLGLTFNMPPALQTFQPSVLANFAAPFLQPLVPPQQPYFYIPANPAAQNSSLFPSQVWQHGFPGLGIPGTLPFQPPWQHPLSLPGFRQSLPGPILNQAPARPSQPNQISLNMLHLQQTAALSSLAQQTGPVVRQKKMLSIIDSKVERSISSSRSSRGSLGEYRQVDNASDTACEDHPDRPNQAYEPAPQMMDDHEQELQEALVKTLLNEK